MRLFQPATHVEVCGTLRSSHMVNGRGCRTCYLSHLMHRVIHSTFDHLDVLRSDGLGELYAYLPLIPPNTSRLLAVPPQSVQNPDYGFSVGRGAWTFATGRWTSIAQRVKMNDVGSANGEIEVFIDGRSVIQVTGLILRTQEHPASHVQGLHFQTFFGGHTAEWASPQDQKAWFRHISGAILGPVEAAHRAGSHDEF